MNQSNQIEIFSDTKCILGEGPLWNRNTEELFWVDIKTHTIYSKSTTTLIEKKWQLEIGVSAVIYAIDDYILFCANGNIYKLVLATGAVELVRECIALKDGIRTNDARVDKHGCLWFSTMSDEGKEGQGSIYRVTDTKVITVADNITIPNSICFSADKKIAYYTDSALQKIFMVKLNSSGNPVTGTTELFVDLTGTSNIPDGSVTDTHGNLWNAQWDGWRIVCYTPTGKEKQVIELPIQRPTCPCFGTTENVIYVTSADTDVSSSLKDDGKTYQVTNTVN